MVKTAIIVSTLYASCVPVCVAKTFQLLSPAVVLSVLLIVTAMTRLFRLSIVLHETFLMRPLSILFVVFCFSCHCLTVLLVVVVKYRYVKNCFVFFFGTKLRRLCYCVLNFDFRLYGYVLRWKWLVYTYCFIITKVI